MMDDDKFREISAEALATLGAPQIVYIKPLHEDKTGRYAIHAADGQPIAVLANREAAWSAAVENNMLPSSLH